MNWGWTKAGWLEDLPRLATRSGSLNMLGKPVGGFGSMSTCKQIVLRTAKENQINKQKWGWRLGCTDLGFRIKRTNLFGGFLSWGSTRLAATYGNACEWWRRWPTVRRTARWTEAEGEGQTGRANGERGKSDKLVPLWIERRGTAPTTRGIDLHNAVPRPKPLPRTNSPRRGARTCRRSTPPYGRVLLDAFWRMV